MIQWSKKRKIVMSLFCIDLLIVGVLAFFAENNIVLGLFYFFVLIGIFLAVVLPPKFSVYPNEIVEDNLKKWPRSLLWALLILFIPFIVTVVRIWVLVPSNSFKNGLKGEIVYSYRTDGKVLDIYSMSANGKNKRLLFHNSHPSNANSIHPAWSDNGAKIRFVAMKNGWDQWVMEANGANPTVFDEKPPGTTTRISREDDIVVDEGDIFYVDKDGKKQMIYDHKNWEAKTNGGPFEVRWGPNKEYVIASLDGDVVIIRRQDGKMEKITKGYYADWKF